MTGVGFVFSVEWNPASGPSEKRCLRCGQRFVLDAPLVVTALALGEPVGVVGTCCMAPCAVARLKDECENVEMEYGHA
jgi:hypothetical protein